MEKITIERIPMKKIILFLLFTITINQNIHVDQGIINNENLGIFFEKTEDLSKFFSNFEVNSPWKESFYRDIQNIFLNTYEEFSLALHLPQKLVTNSFCKFYPEKEDLLNACNYLLEIYENGSSLVPKINEDSIAAKTTEKEILKNIIYRLSLPNNLQKIIQSENFLNLHGPQHILLIFEIYRDNELINHILWQLYIIQELKKIAAKYPLTDVEKALFFDAILHLIVNEKKALQTLDMVNFYDLTKSLFMQPDLRDTIFEEAKTHFSINGEMGKTIINQRMLLVALIGKNRDLGKKAADIIREIKKIDREEENDEDMYNLFRSLVPDDMIGGKNASTFFYAINSIYKQHKGPTMQFATLLLQDFMANERSNNQVKQKYSLFSKMLFGPVLRFFGGKSYEGNTIFAESTYTFTDLQYYYGQFNSGAFSTKIIPFFTALFWAGFDLANEFSTVKTMYSTFLGIRQTLKFFSKLKKRINLLHELYLVIQKMYQRENISEEHMPFNIYEAHKIFVTETLHTKFIESISNWGKGIVGKIKVAGSLIAPGTIAKFYYSEIAKNPLFSKLNKFMNSVVFALAKFSLLRSDSQDFCFPTVLSEDESEPTFDAEDLWYAFTPLPVKNSFFLGNKKNCMLIGSPTGAGKTVFLIDMLSNILLANMGITCGKKLTFTFFTHICNRIRPEYKIGQESSGKLEETRSLIMLNKILEERARFRIYTLLLIDELFSRTKESIAPTAIMFDIAPILEKNGCITVITTHLTGIIPIIIKNFPSTELYYFDVQEDKNENFYTTHKLLSCNLNNPEDLEKNWWVSSSPEAIEKQRRYETFQHNIQNKKIQEKLRAQ